MRRSGNTLQISCPTAELLAHRFGKGEKCMYKYFKAFHGKASVGLKMRAYAAMPRACVTFLAPIIHWTGAMLRGAVRRERFLEKDVKNEASS